MAISKDNKLIQVKVSKLSYEYIKQFSDKFDVSISNFCEDCITGRILELNRLSDEEIKKHALYINQIYKSGKRSK